jgi:Ca-activated chloride channel family protein
MTHTVPLDDTAPSSSLGVLFAERGRLPLTDVRLDATVTGLVATVELEQRFVNTFDDVLEVTYVFPLPDRAGVTSFVAELGGRTVTGVLRERGEARAAYDRAVAHGQRAGIVEEERPDVFTVRIGNLPAREAAVVRLRLVGPVPFEAGEATFRFPLVVAPRYIPGTALDGLPVGDGVALDTDAVPDASRISPPVLLAGNPNPVRVSGVVTVDPAGLIADGFEAPIVALTGLPPAPVRDAVRVEVATGERLDADLVLRWRLRDAVAADADGHDPFDPVALALLAPDADGDGATLLATVLPPPAAAEVLAPRDVVVVLDRSGSMDGWKMVAARRAAARIVDSLTSRDRVAALAFDTVVEYEPSGARGLRPATDRDRFRIATWLGGIEARGGTELHDVLSRAVGFFDATAGRDRYLVVVTDGQVGDEDRIVADLAPRLNGVRVLAVGIDLAVNAGLLHRLAALGERGHAEFVESEDRLDRVLHDVHTRISPSVLDDVRLEVRGATVGPDSVAPASAVTCVAGAALTVGTRLTLESPATGAGGDPVVAVVGTRPDGTPWTRVLPVRVVGADAVTPLWARARVRDLEDAWVRGHDGWSVPDDDGLEQRIVDTSLRFGVLSRFTAFVAVDDEAAVVDGDLHRMTQPVEPPRGWAAATLVPRIVPSPVYSAPPATFADAYRVADDSVPHEAFFGGPSLEVGAEPMGPRPVGGGSARGRRGAWWRRRPSGDPAAEARSALGLLALEPGLLDSPHVAAIVVPRIAEAVADELAPGERVTRDRLRELLTGWCPALRGEVVERLLDEVVRVLEDDGLLRAETTAADTWEVPGD